MSENIHVKIFTKLFVLNRYVPTVVGTLIKLNEDGLLKGNANGTD